MEFATRFESSLPAPRERFLAHLLQHGLECGVRTADDFVRHFTPATIMDALAGEPELRADILEPTVGVRRKVAVRKSAVSAAEDLHLALEEGETSPDIVLEHFPADDRVRHLDPAALWTYATESGFWNTRGADDGPERAHVEHLLRVALDEELISARDVMDGLGVERLVEHLPGEQVARVLAAVLDAGRSGNMFDDVELLNVVGCEQLTRHVPLKEIWTRVLEPKLAETPPEAAAKTDPATAETPKADAASAPVAKDGAAGEAGTPPLAEFDDSSELFDPESMMRDLTPEESVDAKPEEPPKKQAKPKLAEPTVPKRPGGLPPPKKARKGAVPPPLPS